MTMNKSFFDILGEIIDYIFNIKLFDLPRLIVYLGVSAGIGYCLSLIVIGFPCSIYEEVTKKKIKAGLEDKLIRIGTIFFISILWLRLLYELATK